MGERARQGARCTGRCSLSTASVGVPSSFASFILECAQSSDRDGAGSHRRRHLTKIGAGSGRRFVAFHCGRDDNSGAGCIPRTRLLVIARSTCDEAIQGPPALSAGLLRYARNDGKASAPAIAGEGDHAKHGGGGAGGEEDSASQEKRRGKRPSHRASARSPLPAIAGRDEERRCLTSWIGPTGARFARYWIALPSW
jgi:hypothetical protein